MRIGAVVLLVGLVVAGCGAGTGRHIAVSNNGKAVIEDAYDGHLNHDWSCGSLRAAFDRLPGDRVGPGIQNVIGPAAAAACDDALGGIRAGETKNAIALTLGRPDTAGWCWVFDWPPADAGRSTRYRMTHPKQQRSSVDGARICFNDSNATLVQTSVHL